MSDIEQALSQILSDPQALTSVFNIIKNVENTANSENKEAEDNTKSIVVNKSAVDTDNYAGIALLQALKPFMSAPRREKIDNATQLMKLAGMASILMNSKKEGI